MPETSEQRFKGYTEARKKWNKKEYQRTLLLTLEITDKCTLECAHCFASASPRNDTFLEAELVNKLAQDSIELFHRYPLSLGQIADLEFFGQNLDEHSDKTASSIRITGGDPFLHPDLYKIIDSFRKRGKQLGCPPIDVETNGWWASTDDETRKIILELREAGASCVSMSYGYYHRENSFFPNLEHGKRLENLAKELSMPFRFITNGMPLQWSMKDEKGQATEFSEWIPGVVPVGRARQLDRKYWEAADLCFDKDCRIVLPPNEMITEFHVQDDELTIGPQGNVYLCNSGRQFDHATLAIGNLHQAGILQILQEDANPIVRLLREKGVVGLSEVVGFSPDEHDKLLNELTPCGFCHELLSNYGYTITERLRLIQK